MRLRFTKMHGLGNDFVVIDAISQRVKMTADRVRRLAERRFGVGCDQVLLVELPESPDLDFQYRIFNADGTEVENCGNGARCFARFVRERKLTGKNRISVGTAGGRLELQVRDNGDVSVDMGIPGLDPRDLPFDASARATTYCLDLPGEHETPTVECSRSGSNDCIDTPHLEISAVSLGNPHAVLLVNSVSSAPVTTLGPQIEHHQRFPRRVNVGFMEIISRREINLRVYERGVGETHACGTGACAAVVAGRLRNLLDSEVKVNLPGGSLLIAWPGEGASVLMTGPATTVFHGQIKLP